MTKAIPATLSTVCLVSPQWMQRHAQVLEHAGFSTTFVADAREFGDTLAREWAIDLVVIDLDLATAELAARLGPSGPRVLAFGNPANAGLALRANLADFIPDDPTDRDLRAALESALAVVSHGVADLSDRSASRREASAAEAMRVAAALARLADPGSRPPPSVDAIAVRAVIRARRARERFFAVEILGDPGWDMLLDLTLARSEDRDVSVSSLCLAARVPATTALRWIRNLCDTGLFERVDDPGDARRAFIRLADPTAAAMAEYLAAFAVSGS